MKKVRMSIFVLVLTLVLGSVSVSADPLKAEEYEAKTSWTVEYKDGKLNSTSTTGSLKDSLKEMQPGDSISYTVTLKNSAEKNTNWYINNRVAQSFEESVKASGGAYSYELNYSGPGGNLPLYTNQTVGGDDTTGGVGLHKVEGDEDEDYFLDTLKKGDTATVTLKVSLEGVTQNNDYQTAIADLELIFGVEEEAEPETKRVERRIRKVVKTGDDRNMMPYFIMAAVSGVILLIVAFFLRRRNSKEADGRG